MQPLNNLTPEISSTNGSSINTNNNLLDSLCLGKLKINLKFTITCEIKYLYTLNLNKMFCL
jgi:hypothetical protein